MDPWDLGESLPSHSTFLAPVYDDEQEIIESTSKMAAITEEDEIDEQTRRSYNFKLNGRVSPPPPPPPSKKHEFQSSDRSSNKSRVNSHNESKNSGESGKKKGPFPFLRKNSRTEPTALNKMLKKSNSNQDIKRTDSEGLNEEGLDYFSESPKNIEHSKNNYNQKPTYNNKNYYNYDQDVSKDNDTSEISLNQSTITFDPTTNWKNNNKKQEVITKELEEFEIIEKQLENIPYDHINKNISKNNKVSNSYNKTQPISNNINSSQNNDFLHGTVSIPSIDRFKKMGENDDYMENTGVLNDFSYKNLEDESVLQQSNVTDFDGIHSLGTLGTEYLAGKDNSYHNTRSQQEEQPQSPGELFYSPNSNHDSNSIKNKMRLSNSTLRKIRQNTVNSDLQSSSENRPKKSFISEDMDNYREKTIKNEGFLNLNESIKQESSISYSSQLNSHNSQISGGSFSSGKRVPNGAFLSGGGQQDEQLIRPRPNSSTNNNSFLPRNSSKKAITSSIQRSVSNKQTNEIHTSDELGGGDSLFGGLPHVLQEKAKELQNELETYRSENSTVKRLRKEQESALQEIINQKEEVLKWCNEKKEETEKWCQQQKLQAEKERKSAAKAARDSRLKASSGAVPIRKEKAEIEGLNATIEKMKIDHNSSIKRYKTNEQRLSSLIKEHAKHIETLENQLLQVEDEKIALLDFISQSNLRLPKSIRQLLQKNNSSHPTPAKHLINPNAVKNSNYLIGDKSHIEEVDVEELENHLSHTYDTSDGLKPNFSYNTVNNTVGDNKNDFVGNNRKEKLNATVGDNGSRSFSKLHSQRDTYAEEESDNFFGHLSSERNNIKSKTTQLSKKNDFSSQSQDNYYSPVKYGNDVFGSEDDDFGYKSRNLEGLTRESISKRQNPGDVFNQLSSTLKSGSIAIKSPSSSSNKLNNSFTPDKNKSTKSNTLINGLKSTDMAENDGINGKGTGRYSNSWARSSARYSNTTDETDGLDDQNGELYGVVDNNYDRNSHGNLVMQKTMSEFNVNIEKDNPNIKLKDSTNNRLSKSDNNSKNRVEEQLSDGSKIISYRNGTIKEVQENGDTLVRFTNGDTKKVIKHENTVIYFYAEAETTHTTFQNGLEVYEFPNQQIEKHYPNGIKEITFPDRTKKIIHPTGVQESQFPDGVILKEYPDGRKEIMENN